MKYGDSGFEIPLKRRAATAAGLALTLFFFSAPRAPAAESDDAYLRELKAEAQKLEILGKAKEEIRQSEEQEKKQAQAKGQVPDKTRDQNRHKTSAKPAITNVGEMEKALRVHAPASFNLYSTLTPEKKRFVYQAYVDSGAMSVAKRRIVELYLNL